MVNNEREYMQHISQCGGDVYIVEYVYFCMIAILNLI